MAKRKIVLEGDEILTKPARPVERIDARLIELLDDMAETLRDAGGVGLAAPQVGILRRVVVIDAGGEEMLELINPELIYTAGEQSGLEGCLSCPQKWGIVTRPMHARVRATNRNGELFEVDGEGLIARAFCHELDHLNGELFLDKVERFLTEEELREMEKEEKGERGERRERRERRRSRG